VLLALTVFALLAQLVDARTIAGVNVWVKPAKFLFSVGLYAVTMAWFFGYVRPERRSALAMRALVVVLLVGTTLPLAWEIARRPAAGLRTDFTAAMVIGLVLTFVLGGGLGLYMSSQSGHAVGAVGGHVPLFGWNRSGGDLRVAHFFAIHAQQAIPLLAFAVGAARARMRWALLIGGAALYTAVTVGAFAQAVAGGRCCPREPLTGSL
jgi:hypothetical protein